MDFFILQYITCVYNLCLNYKHLWCTTVYKIPGQLKCGLPWFTWFAGYYVSSWVYLMCIQRVAAVGSYVKKKIEKLNDMNLFSDIRVRGLYLLQTCSYKGTWLNQFY